MIFIVFIGFIHIFIYLSTGIALVLNTVSTDTFNKIKVILVSKTTTQARTKTMTDAFNKLK